MKANDPSTWLACQEPKTPQQAEADWAAFCEEVYAARVRHKIPAVYLVGRLHTVDGESVAVNHGRLMCGDDLLALTLAALAFGYESSAHKAMIQQLAGGTAKPARQRELF